MKMSTAHFVTLKAACEKVLSDSPDAREAYRAQGLSDKRFRWDVLHAARINGEPSYRFTCDILYPAGLNDAHIDTALRLIVGS